MNYSGQTILTIRRNNADSFRRQGRGTSRSNFGRTGSRATPNGNGRVRCIAGTGIVNPVLFKAILNTDALVLIANGDPKIRTMQQGLNRKYLAYIGIMPL